MEPLIELPPQAKARIRAIEAKAAQESDMVRRAFEGDLERTNRDWGGYVDLHQDKLREAASEARAGVEAVDRISAEMVFVAHARQYHIVVSDHHELEALLARLREAVITHYGQQTRASVQLREAEIMKKVWNGEMPNPTESPTSIDHLTDVQRELDRYRLSRELARELGQRCQYPTTLYHPNGQYRVTHSPEEHAEFRIEGWRDKQEQGKQYRVWTAVQPPGIPKDAGRPSAAPPITKETAGDGPSAEDSDRELGIVDPGRAAALPERKIEPAARNTHVHLEPPDLDERKAAYNAYKRVCKDAGAKMTEAKLARLANRRWNTRDPVMKWKEGKDRPGDDGLIRRAMQKGPTASKS